MKAFYLILYCFSFHIFYMIFTLVLIPYSWVRQVLIFNLDSILNGCYCNIEFPATVQHVYIVPLHITHTAQPPSLSKT
jgi:hypothetical protein